MKKLHQLLDQHLFKGDLGLEIETEGRNIRPMDHKFWRCERDGSLRGEFPHSACEFVLKSPLSLSNLQKAFAEFDEVQKDTTWKLSSRCSTHVHVNMQNYTWDELLAFIYLCLLVEIPLMNFCEEHRRSNRFALRLSDAEAAENHLIRLFSGTYTSIIHLRGDEIRYSAINLHSLQKYGSVEFRGLEGTTDWKKINTWCETLLQLRSIAVKLGNPAAVHNYFIEKTNKEFLNDVFGKHAALFASEDNEHGLDTNYSLTVALPRLWRAASQQAAPVAPVADNGRYVVKRGVYDGLIVDEFMNPPVPAFEMNIPVAPRVRPGRADAIAEGIRQRIIEQRLDARLRAAEADGEEFIDPFDAA